MIKLINTFITSHSYHLCVYVVGILMTYSLSKFQMYNVLLLTIVTMLYLRPPELIHFIIRSLYP